MYKICLHHSENQPVFALYKDKSNATIKLARECSRNDFAQIDANTLIYKNKYQIYLEPRYCVIVLANILLTKEDVSIKLAHVLLPIMLIIIIENS